MQSFQGVNVLVAGGTGLIGIPLVELLFQEGARVRIASLDDPSRAHPDAEFRQVDLTDFQNCLDACQGMEYVFNLLCVKGSPRAVKLRPASFFVPMLRFNTNLMEAARISGVGGFLYTSSVGVYAPAEVFKEDTVWQTLPSPNDWFPAWAKRVGELQAEAYRIEYGWKDVSIVRPANVYGPYDNFEGENAMVIPSLIRRIVEGENPLTVWGDGSQRRDFLYARDAARGILLAAQNTPSLPVNLGSGTGTTIRELVETIIGCTGHKPTVVWDTSKPMGDRERILDVSRAKSLLGFEPQVSLAEGIGETMRWFQEYRHHLPERHDVFAKT